MHNITQFGSYYALNIFFHRHHSRHIERSRTNSSLPGLHLGSAGAADPSYQGAGWGLLELPWGYVQGGRGGRGVGGSLTNVLKLKLSNINLNA